MRFIQLIFIACCLVACATFDEDQVSREPYHQDETEQFIRESLMNEDGELRTNLTNRKEEYLSESLGLWMLYLVKVGDATSFERLHPIVKHWMTRSGAVYWMKDRGEWMQATASIDDLRIAYAYLLAFEKWENDEYYKTGEKIVTHFAHRQIVQGKFSDFYDLRMKKEGNVQTTSYYNEHALRAFARYEWLDYSLVEQWIQKRKNEPTDKSLYPPTRYLIEEERYEFDEEVNGIDIAYTLLYRADWTEREQQLYEMWRTHFLEEGSIAGRLNRNSEPLVSYESPALYALLGLVALRQNDHILVEQLCDKLYAMQKSEEVEKQGQFVDELTGDLHVFDHLLFLIFKHEVKYGDME